jgi:hypothetical protein
MLQIINFPSLLAIQQTEVANDSASDASDSKASQSKPVVD